MHDSDEEDFIRKTIEGQFVPLSATMAQLDMQEPAWLTIDGKAVTVPRITTRQDPAGKLVARMTTIYDAALRVFGPVGYGGGPGGGATAQDRGPRVPIPILCHREYMAPVAVCRVCSVEVAHADGRKEPR